MNKHKILGLMLASNNCEGPYKCYANMVDICKRTWIEQSKKNENIKIFSIYGRDHTNNYMFIDEQNILIYDDSIIVNTPDRRNNLLRKTIKSMEYCLKHYPDYTHYFRPNCGSYINTRLLYNFLSDKPLERYYSAINGIYQNIKYASGSCILMSKDIVQFLVDNQDKLEYNGNILMDDVSIGYGLLSNGYLLYNDALRIDCPDAQTLIQNFNTKCYHYYFCHTINPKLINLCHELTLNHDLV